MPAARTLTKAQETKLARLLKQGMPRNQIAKELKLPPSTLGDMLKRRAAQAVADGVADPAGTPFASGEDTATAQAHAAGMADEDYRADEEPPDVDQGITAILPADEPATAVAAPEVPVQAAASAQEVPLHLVQEVVDLWPDLKRMLAWWQDRERALQEPAEPLERVTYHVARKWIEAVRREADQTGESYASVVNRAFALYFTRET